MTEEVKDPMNDFLNEGYDLPDTSEYMKLVPGKNKFRVLSSVVTGYEYWTTENKPVRSKEKPVETPNIKVEKNGKSSISHFWAMVVYNYDADAIQTLEITQKGIQKYIVGLTKDPVWGSPKKYDLVIDRSGAGLETKYTTVANPHTPVSDDIQKKFEASKIDLEAMFKND